MRLQFETVFKSIPSQRSISLFFFFCYWTINSRRLSRLSASSPPLRLLDVHLTMDLEYCESVNGDACGGVFPYKTSLGLCAKCKKLADLEPGSAEHQSWKVLLNLYHYDFF